MPHPGTGDEAQMAEFLSNLNRDTPVLTLAQGVSSVGVAFFESNEQIDRSSDPRGLRAALGRLHSCIDNLHRPIARYAD